MFQEVLRFYQRQIPGHSLAVFRICYGLVMAYEFYTYTRHDFDKASRYLVEPRFVFPFYGLDWLPRFTSLALCRAFFPASMLVSLMFSAGLAYRAVAVLQFAAFFWLSFQDLALYLNHFMLINLLNALTVVLPLNRCLSLDRRLAAAQSPTGQAPEPVVGHWALSVLRFTVGIVYFHAALAKLNADWMFRCSPLDMWLPVSHPLPFGLSKWQQEEFWFACFFSWSGFALDFLAPLGLYHPKTRVLALIFTSIFHLTNKLILNIGIFPYMMLCLSLLFLSPFTVARIMGYSKLQHELSSGGSTSQSFSKPFVVSWTVFALLLCLFPLRHWLYPGDVAWNEEGHRFSWRMKLRDKVGFTRFYLVDQAQPDQLLQVDETSLSIFLTRKQERKMPGRPEMIHSFALALHREAFKETGRNFSVFALSIASLNGRRPQFLIDPRVDLTQRRLWDWPYDFVLPLLPYRDVAQGPPDETTEIAERKLVPWKYEREIDLHFLGSAAGEDLEEIYVSLSLQESQRWIGKFA